MAIPEKHIINGNTYTIGKKLGSGRQGAVYEATLEGDKEPKYCIKRQYDKDRTAQEAAVIDRHFNPPWQQPSEVKTETGCIRDSFLLVMPKVKGKNLKVLQKEGLTLYERLTIAEKLRQDLNALHDHRILHRDIKRDNIMVNIIENDIEVKIIDLGRAAFLDDDQQEQRALTQFKLRMLFQPWTAPEFIVNNKSIDKHSDYYSFGKVYLHLFPDDLTTYKALTSRHEYGKRQATYNDIVTALDTTYTTECAALADECRQYISKRDTVNTRVMKELETALRNAKLHDVPSLKTLAEKYNAANRHFNRYQEPPSFFQRIYILLEKLGFKKAAEWQSTSTWLGRKDKAGGLFHHSERAKPDIKDEVNANVHPQYDLVSYRAF